MPLASGASLGPYRIEQPIGAGGMGEVYRARDSRLDRTVAIKVLLAHLAANPELRQRFEREARAVAALNHPHICVLHDIGQQDGIDYLVMEYLESETLAQRLTELPGGRPATPVPHPGRSLGAGLPLRRERRRPPLPHHRPGGGRGPGSCYRRLELVRRPEGKVNR